MCSSSLCYHKPLHANPNPDSDSDPDPNPEPQVAAPGGDGAYQLSTEAQNGEVLSTWPSLSALSDGADAALLTDGVGGHYGYLQVSVAPGNSSFCSKP